MDTRRTVEEINGVRSRVDQETYGDPEANTGGSVPANVETRWEAPSASTPGVTVLDSETGSGVIGDDMLNDASDDEDLMEQAVVVRGEAYTLPSHPPDQEASDDSSDEIRAARAEIEQTRAEMSSTIDEIKDRLSPAHLIEEAKEATVGRVEEKVSEVVETVKETAGNVFEAAKEKASDVFHAAKDKASDAVEAVKDVAHNAAEKIDEMRSASKPADSAQMSINYYNENNVAAPSRVVNGLRNTGEIIVETIRVNPIPAAIAGFGIGWLLLSMQKQRSSESYESTYTPSDYYRDNNDVAYDNGASHGLRDRASQFAQNVSDRASDMAHAAGDKASDIAHTVSDKATGVAHTVGDRATTLAHTVGDKASEFAHTVGGKASDIKDRAGQLAVGVKDKASDIASNVRDRAGDLADTTKTQYRAASDSVEHFVDEQPLATAAIALVIGAAVGLMIPASPIENRIAGPQRDRLMDQAGDAFQNVSHRVQNVAQAALGQAKTSLTQTVEQTKQTVRDEVESQGLTSPAMAIS